MRSVLALIVTAAAIVAAVALFGGSMLQDPRAAGVKVPAGGPLPLAVEPDPDDSPEMDLTAPPIALAPPGGAIVQQGLVRIPKPKIDLKGARRVGIQIGHLDTTNVPKEYGTRIQFQTGTSWAGYKEVDVNEEIAERIATLLKAQGIEVDLIPTTVPEGYVADAFVALHCDGDGVGELSGFKMAHSTRRNPYEDALLNSIKSSYANATGLPYDAEHISRAMVNLYSFNWSRYQHATSAFTPSTIIELGFLSNDEDREILVNHADRVATGVVNGLLSFLDTHPRSKLFAEDLLIPQAPIRQGPVVTPSPGTNP